jgi:hypothetical protein
MAGAWGRRRSDRRDAHHPAAGRCWPGRWPSRSPAPQPAGSRRAPPPADRPQQWPGAGRARGRRRPTRASLTKLMTAYLASTRARRQAGARAAGCRCRSAPGRAPGGGSLMYAEPRCNPCVAEAAARPDRASAATTPPWCWPRRVGGTVENFVAQMNRQGPGLGPEEHPVPEPRRAWEPATTAARATWPRWPRACSASTRTLVPLYAQRQYTCTTASARTTATCCWAATPASTA